MTDADVIEVERAGGGGWVGSVPYADEQALDGCQIEATGGRVAQRDPPLLPIDGCHRAGDSGEPPSA